MLYKLCIIITLRNTVKRKNAIKLLNYDLMLCVIKKKKNLVVGVALESCIVSDSSQIYLLKQINLE